MKRWFIKLKVSLTFRFVICALKILRKLNKGMFSLIMQRSIISKIESDDAIEANIARIILKRVYNKPCNEEFENLKKELKARKENS